MIIESIFNLIFFLLKTVFNLLPTLPNLSNENVIGVYDFFDNFIFSNLELIDIFIRPSTIKLIVPLLIIVINFEHIWEFIMFIWRKLPISSE